MMSRFPPGIFLLVLVLAGASCRQDAESSKEKAGRAEREAMALKEREAINAFARQIDEMLHWRASQDSPVEPAAAAAAIASRLQAISSDALPGDLRAALGESRSAWSSLASVLAKQNPDTGEVEEKTRQADAADGRLNQILAARGFPDVAL